MTAMAWSRICSASAMNTSLLATKSVSQRTSTRVPTPSSALAATSPFEVVRPSRLVTPFWPLTRRISVALAWSPSASSRAFLTSSMPAPVCSRSALMSAAVKFAMVVLALFLGVEEGDEEGRSGRRVGGLDLGVDRLVVVVGLRNRHRLGTGRTLGRRVRGGLGHLGLGRHGRGGLVGRLGGGGLGVELALPLGQRLLGGDLLVTGGAATAGARDDALGDGVGDHPGQQGDRADRVVVAGDLVVDLVGVAVGVEDRDDGKPELAGLVDGEVLLLRVDDPDRRRDALNRADTAQRLLQLDLLALEDEELLLRAARTGHVVEVDLLELLQAGEPLGDRVEVGEHAAQPAVVDVGHPDARRLVGDRLLSLLLGADEEDRAAVGDRLPHELVGVVDVRQRLLQVDDVDPVALGHDEALHLGVPASGLVPEVDAALEELAHGDNGHAVSSWCVVVGSVGGTRCGHLPGA